MFFQCISSTPAAESPAAPPALGITFLGVRRGRRPVIPPPWACGAFFGAPGVSRVHFLGPRGSLGGSWGSPVALLEGSWGVRGPFWSRLFGYEILRLLFDPKREVSRRILEALGCPKGGILGAKMAPKSIPNRSRNLRGNNLPLGSDLGRFWMVLERSPEGIFIDFLLVFL